MTCAARGFSVAQVFNTEGTELSHAPHSQNLAARMGRWSASHWKTATFGWLGLIIAAFAVGGQVGTKTVDPNTAGPGPSRRMGRILAARFQHPASWSGLVPNSTAPGGAPQVDAGGNGVGGASVPLA